MKGTRPFIFVKGRVPLDAVRQVWGSVQPAFR